MHSKSLIAAEHAEIDNLVVVCCSATDSDAGGSFQAAAMPGDGQFYWLAELLDEGNPINCAAGGPCPHLALGMCRVRSGLPFRL